MTSGLREKIIGGWVLESYLETDIEVGSSVEPFGPQAFGFILYTPDGYMSAQIQALNRPLFKSGDMFRGEPAEYVASASTYLAYSGHYHVDEASNRIIHHVAVSLFPNWIGVPQVRLVDLQRDRLRLSFEKPIRFNGALKSATLTWRRQTATERRIGMGGTPADSLPTRFAESVNHRACEDSGTTAGASPSQENSVQQEQHKGERYDDHIHT